MKILGLDLGVASIGWAVIEVDENMIPVDILGLGSRIVNLRNNEAKDFYAGKGESVCSTRTMQRTARKCLDRYQLRRADLMRLGIRYGLIGNGHQFPALGPVEVWGLRAKAATPGEQISLEELLRVLLHINQKRGYKHAKSDGDNSKTTDYVAKVNERYSEIHSTGKTVGQYFYDRIKESETITEKGGRFYNFRIRDKVLPRRIYQEEFEAIMAVQSEFYPEILTDKVIDEFRRAIFYQRPLKSCKHLVSYCEFEKRLFKNKNGKVVDGGPKVTPASSPLAQMDRIYEAINNITLVNSSNRKNRLKNTNPSLFDNEFNPVSTDARKTQYRYELNSEERQRVFDFMWTHEKISETELLKILGLKKGDGFRSDKALGKGIQGNPTYCKIKNAIQSLGNYEEMLRFNVSIIDSGKVDEETGEILKIVDQRYTEEPLYKLWHTLYSISDRDELQKVLAEKFVITDEEVVSKLYGINFVGQGYANKSAKFMRKLIPLLRQGYQFPEASARLGINHSNSLTKEENAARELKDRLELLPKNSLRQPTVEKILNQMINLVNAVKDEFGEIDEVRVELARELRQSRMERERTAKIISEREKENAALEERIREFGIIPSRRRVQKMRMLDETGNTCIYCGRRPVSPALFVEGHGYEVEHIIPRSKVFNDSFSNKVCSCRECNQAKGNRTAFDFMEAQPDEFPKYCERVDQLYKERKISRSKRDNLMKPESKIDAGFIERDLRLSQYISRKARLILMETFRNVYASSGSVTDFFRHSWGYDMILHNLNFEKYDRAGLTEDVEYCHDGQVHHERRIKDWSKRKDHRHHAIDALVIALTRQGYVQRLSTLNSTTHDSESKSAAKENLDKWAARQPHFPYAKVCESVEGISISLKAGKKLATPGKRYVVKKGKRVCVQTGVLVPRGQLHLDTVYGIIRDGSAPKTLNKALEKPELIVDRTLRVAIEKILADHHGDIAAVKKWLKNNPVMINGKEADLNRIACFSEETVVKYAIDTVRYKDIESIVDTHIRKIIKARFEECGNNDKLFLQSLKQTPLYSDSYNKSEIRSVRMKTGIKREGLASIRKDKNGNAIGFAQTRNNHHVSFYENEDGKVQTIAVSFWTAIKRKRYGIPIIVKNPVAAWDCLVSIENPIDMADIQASLPTVGSRFVGSMSINEMFVLGMDDDSFNDAVSYSNMMELNKHLFRVQNLADGDYVFSFHTCTTAEMKGDNMTVGDKKRVSYSALMALNPKKVRISILGKMIPIDD